MVYTVYWYGTITLYYSTRTKYANILIATTWISIPLSGLSMRGILTVQYAYCATENNGPMQLANT